MKRFLSGVLLASVLAFPGCSTGLQIWSMDEGAAVMGGMRMVGQTFTADYTTGGDIAFAILDAPLSLVMDIVVLPFSAINEIVEGGIDVRYPPEVKPRSVRYHGERKRSDYERNRFEHAATVQGLKTDEQDEIEEASAPDEEGAADESTEADVAPDAPPGEDPFADDLESDLDDMEADAPPPAEDGLEDDLDDLGDDDMGGDDMGDDLGDDLDDMGDEGPMDDELGEDDMGDLEDDMPDEAPLEDDMPDEAPLEDDMPDEAPLEDE